MEKGKRYSVWHKNDDARLNPDGSWLYDPDKDAVPFADYEAATLRADCYEEQMKDLARTIDPLKARATHLEKTLKEQPGALKQLLTQWKEAQEKIRAAIWNSDYRDGCQYEIGQHTVLKVCLADLSTLIRIWEKL